MGLFEIFKKKKKRKVKVKSTSRGRTSQRVKQAEGTQVSEVLKGIGQILERINNLERNIERQHKEIYSVNKEGVSLLLEWDKYIKDIEVLKSELVGLRDSLPPKYKKKVSKVIEKSSNLIALTEIESKIIELLQERKYATPKELLPLVNSQVNHNYTIDSLYTKVKEILLYLYDKGVVDKYKEGRNVFYFLKEEVISNSNNIVTGKCNEA